MISARNSSAPASPAPRTTSPALEIHDTVRGHGPGTAPFCRGLRVSSSRVLQPFPTRCAPLFRVFRPASSLHTARCTVSCETRPAYLHPRMCTDACEKFARKGLSARFALCCRVGCVRVWFGKGRVAAPIPHVVALMCVALSVAVCENPADGGAPHRRAPPLHVCRRTRPSAVTLHTLMPSAP